MMAARVQANSGLKRPIPRNLLIIALTLSLLIHFSVIGFTALLERFKPAERPAFKALEVSLVESPLLESVKSLQETADVAPEVAQFASDRNLKAEQQTSPERQATNVATPSQGSAQQVIGNQNQQQKTQQRSRKSFSLSNEELVAMNDPMVLGSALGQDAPPSAGFIERLERGEQLKVNALGLDYGQYLIRMKERLIKRWNPRRIISAEMYDYEEITVTLAVVLNSQGELVDLRVMDKSFFPLYDKEALDAFRKAGPFPNPPESLIQDDGRIYLPWSFALSFSRWAGSQVY